MRNFRDKLSGMLKNHTHTPPVDTSSTQQPYTRPAPPTPYWAATFALGKQVSDEWVQEQGDHGWGNNELQNYTDSTENAFFRANSHGHPCLVLRAVVQRGRATSARLTSRMTLGRDEGYLSAHITAPSARKMDPFLSYLCTVADLLEQAACGPRSGCCRGSRSRGRRTARSTSWSRGTTRR